MALADFADEPRIGANGAGRRSERPPARNRVPDGGGPPEPIYQPDLNHLTACREQMVSHMTAAAVIRALNAQDGAGAGLQLLVAVAAASSIKPLAIAGRAMTLRGGAHLVLLNHDGLAPSTVVATDAGAEPDTITGGGVPTAARGTRLLASLHTCWRRGGPSRS